MAIKIQIRRDTAQNFTDENPVLAQGEPALEIDTLKEKIGDGVTDWNSLSYRFSSGGSTEMDDMNNMTTSKTTPIDADNITLWDSVGGVFKQLTWANLKSNLKTYFDTLYLGKIGYSRLDDDLILTKTLTPTSPNNYEINWEDGVAFVLPLITADITINHINVVENKIIDILDVKGEFAITHTGIPIVTDDRDGTVLSLIQMKASLVNGVLTVVTTTLNAE